MEIISRGYILQNTHDHILQEKKEPAKLVPSNFFPKGGTGLKLGSRILHK